MTKIDEVLRATYRTLTASIRMSKSTRNCEELAFEAHIGYGTWKLAVSTALKASVQNHSTSMKCKILTVALSVAANERLRQQLLRCVDVGHVHDR